MGRAILFFVGGRVGGRGEEEGVTVIQNIIANGLLLFVVTLVHYTNIDCTYKENKVCSLFSQIRAEKFTARVSCSSIFKQHLLQIYYALLLYFSVMQCTLISQNMLNHSVTVTKVYP